jgi:nucleotide-binding universal stress UspA family protein
MTVTTRAELRIVRPDGGRPDGGRPDGGREEPIGRRIRHALVCLDRTPASEVCLPYANVIADAFDARLTLTHVIPSASSSGGTWSRADVLEWEIARREADRYLDHARELLTARIGAPVETVVNQGTPADRIALTVREVGADLAIVAGHPALAVRGRPIGATVQRLLGSTSASVLVVHGASAAPPRQIVVPLDGSARTECVLPTVIALARTCDAEVTLAHVVQQRPTSAMFARPADVVLAQQLAVRMRESAEEYLLRIRSRELRDLPRVRSIARARTDERRALLELATQVHADLIVLAAHGASCDAADPCGSATSYLLAHACTPLLVLQDVVAASDMIPRDQDAMGPTRRPSGIRRKEDA